MVAGLSRTRDRREHRGALYALVNDVRVLDVAPIDPVPIYDDVGVGVVRADELGFHVYQDDIVVADRRIGC